jgi:hypothetical protein
MNDNSLDFIIEAEKIRKITIENMKKEAAIKEKEEAARKSKDVTKTYKTADYLLDVRGER